MHHACISSSLESTSRFISSVLSLLFACQPISVIITTLGILHSFTPGSKPTFQQILSTLIYFFTHWTAFMIMGLDRTYHAHQFIFILFYFFHFLFIPCGRLSWLSVSFLLHVKYTVLYRCIISYLLLYVVYLSAGVCVNLPVLVVVSVLREVNTDYQQ